MASFSLVANVYFACIGLFALLNLVYVAAAISGLVVGIPALMS